MALTLRSPAFENGGEIPARFTCEGANIAPPLHWDGVPPQTQSLVLIVEDPDAPDPKAPKMTWIHWVLYNIPPKLTGLPEGATSDRLPDGIEQGLTSWKTTGYGGPCPPIGRHRYFHKLYALDTRLSFTRLPTRDDAEAAMQGHVIDSAELMGTYAKAR